MKIKINYNLALVSILSIGVMFLSSCKEVIEIDLNSSSPAIVAEGGIELDSLAQIRLNYTSDYFDPEAPEFIADAEIILSNNNGLTDTLEHLDSGYYIGHKFVGQSNTEYSLSITNDTENYTCNTYLYEPVSLYNITIDTVDKYKFPAPDTLQSWQVDINIKKPKSIDTRFLLQFELNGEEWGDEYYITGDRDKLKDTIDYAFFSMGLQKNDTLDITIYTIDTQMYDFYKMMNDVLNTSTMSSTTPYNPVSNISNGMLGYFAAYTKKTFRVFIENKEYYFEK